MENFSQNIIPQPFVIMFIIAIGLLIFFIWLTHREKKSLFSIYNSFDARDLYVEDLLNAIKQNALRLIVALAIIPLVIVASAFYIRTFSGEISIIAAEKTVLIEENAQLKDQLATMQQAEQIVEGDPAVIDNIKQEYEKAYVNYFYLSRCGKATTYDAALINAMMSIELASNRANADLLDTVISTAMSTYTELYFAAPCNSPDFQTLVDAQKKYSEAVLLNLQSRLTPPR